MTMKTNKKFMKALTNFGGELKEILLEQKENFGKVGKRILSEEPNIVYVDLDGVIADFDGKCNKIRPDLLKMTGDAVFEIKDEMQKEPHFYADLQPIAGAIPAVIELSNLFDVYILSTASWGNVTSWTDKRLWVERHFGKIMEKKLILSHNKGLLRGKFLIDDRIRNGVENFQGEHIHFGTADFPDWNSVLTYLLQKVK